MHKTPVRVSLTDMRAVIGGLLPAVMAVSVLTAAPARAETVWLCHPGQTSDPCDGSLKTTIRQFGKPKKVVTPKAEKDPGTDCFYVYPTVSEQQTPAANLNIDPAQISIAQFQAARFSQICRVYAPMYRQITLTGLFSGATPQDREVAYSDVRAAWQEYRSANPDRPFVLIGHSQGSGMLKRLLSEQIEPDAALRSQMVSAILAGSTVAVPKGKSVGGDFSQIPICTKTGQTGCIISFATFSKRPPDDSLFGKVRTGGAGLEAACTNPVDLRNRDYAPAHSLMRGKNFSGLLGGAANLMFGGKAPSAKTPWLRPKDRYRVKCVHSNGAHVLMAKPIGKSRVLQGAPSANWGVHLVDINLPLGNLVDLVRAQKKAMG